MESNSNVFAQSHPHALTHLFFHSNMDSHRYPDIHLVVNADLDTDFVGHGHSNADSEQHSDPFPEPEPHLDSNAVPQRESELHVHLHRDTQHDSKSEFHGEFHIYH